MPTILVVDDEPAIRALIRASLAGPGWHTIEAADGESALDLAREAAPDLVLLDVALPRLSGLEVCRRLRSDPATARTPVLLLTGAAQPEAAQVGAQGCIGKPFSPQALLAQIRQALP
jgi:two-component system phosphate regulon response regulator PhoB